MEPTRGRRTVLLLAPLLAALLPRPPSAPHASERGTDQGGKTAQAPLVERVTSELVLIEVFVTDTSGRAVPGLGAEDFMLEVDGHRKPIASVEFRTTAVVPPSPPTEAVSPAAGPVVPAAGASGAESPRRFVLFFEDGTSAPQGLTAARRASDRFLVSGLAPRDQVALAAYDKRLRILHDFTTDHEVLRQAIEESLHAPVRYSDFADEEAAHLSEFGRMLRGGHALAAAALATDLCSEELPRLGGVVKALRTLIDSLAPWRGYKAIIFMGDGIPENPAAPFFDQFSDPDILSKANRCTLSLELKDLSRTASASGVAFDTIQTTGLAAGRPADLKRTWRRSNMLESLAVSTGGLASSSNDLLRALLEAEESSRSYYVLGYVPEGPPDGKYHSVRVRCRKGGVSLRWRRGFTRLPPAEAHARALEAAHLLPELYSDMGLELSAIAGPAGPEGRMVDLVLHLPGDKVLFVPEEGRPTTRLEVGVVSVDGELRETFRTARRLRLALSSPLIQGGPRGVDLFYRVRLPVSAQSLTAVVSDEKTGVVGGSHLSLAAAPAESSGVVGLSLYSLSETSLWVEVPAGGTAAEHEEAPAAYSVGPALRSTFAPGEPVACGFRFAAPSRSDAGAWRLVIRRGEEVVRSRALEADVAKDAAVKTPLPVEGLASGEYVLAIEQAVSDRAIERARLPFRIR